jgi:predicted nuclease of predicted toxin-antitoxin system
LPIEVAEILQAANFDTKTVTEQYLSGEKDSIIAQICQKEDRILVTLDLDFADVRSYPPAKYPGLIVIRVQRQDKPHLLPVF